MTPVIYALVAAATSTAPLPPPVAETVFAQVTIRQRVMIRVPAQGPGPRAVPLPVRPVEWRERRGPKCIAMASVGGAAITEADAVDIYLRGGQRMRARLDDECPALDFYSGFYISQTRDGMVCADRDMIHTRSGGKCAIERFRELVPKR